MVSTCGKIKALLSPTKHQFGRLVFRLLSLFLFLSQVPFWVCAPEVIQEAFVVRPPDALSLKQQSVIVVSISVKMMFIAGVALATSIRPHRVIVISFVAWNFTRFVIAVVASVVLDGGGFVVAFGVFDFLFFVLTLLAAFKMPTLPFRRPINIVSIFFGLVTLLYEVCGITSLCAPATMLAQYFDQTSPNQNDTAQLKYLLVMTGVVDLMIASVALCCAIQPDALLTSLFAAFLFAEIILFAHFKENPGDFYYNETGVELWEILMCVLFVGCCFVCSYVPWDLTVTDHITTSRSAPKPNCEDYSNLHENVDAAESSATTNATEGNSGLTPVM